MYRVMLKDEITQEARRIYTGQTTAECRGFIKEHNGGYGMPADAMTLPLYNFGPELAVTYIITPSAG